MANQGKKNWFDNISMNLQNALGYPSKKVSDVQVTNSQEMIRDISALLLSEINKGKIKDASDLLTFITNNSFNQINPNNLFYMLFYYYWIGGEKCRKSIDQKCNKSINDFLNVSKQYNSYFYPFILTESPNRRQNIANYIKTLPNYFIITLSSNTPHAFSIYYNANGSVFIHQISGDENVIQAINTRLNEFNQKRKPLPKAPPKQAPTNNAPPPVPPKPKQAPSKPAETYIFKIGPLPPQGNPNKYGLINKLGEGAFGTNYRARNLDKKDGEEEFYAIKILKPPSQFNPNPLISWYKERQCLIDILNICKQGGILCYKDSFIRKDNNGNDMLVIVTLFLEGYVTLQDYFRDTPSITEKDAKNIYSQIVDTKNKMADICIHHSDLNFGNIMYNPKTKNVKIIDLGLCGTPDEELKYWNVIQNGVNLYNVSSDLARLSELRQKLFLKVKNRNPKTIQETIDLFNNPIKSGTPGCKRGMKSNRTSVIESKYTSPLPGEECISSDEEAIIKKLINDIENKINDPDLNSRYKKIAVKIHPDKINNSNYSQKSKERCQDLLKILTDLRSSS